MLAYSGKVSAKLDEYLCCYPLTFANQTKKDVFGAYVVVSQLEGFAQ